MVAFNVSTLKAFHYLVISAKSAFANGFFLPLTCAASVSDQVELCF